MNKTLKTVLIIVLALVLIGLCIGGYFIWRHTTTYIGKDAALSIAVQDAGVNVTQIKKTDADFEKNAYAAWYDVEIDMRDGTEYKYDVDAKTGEILNSRVELDNDRHDNDKHDKHDD